MVKIFPIWPFEEDEEVTIHWVSSPRISYGRKECTVYLRASDGAIKAIQVPWGLLLELCIGRKFINNTPIKSTIAERTITLYTSQLYKKSIKKAAELIPRNVYPLENKFVCVEKCCEYEYDGYTYIIPCVEIARVFFGRTSVLAKQLISSGGLEEMIDVSSWQIEGDVLNFMFCNETPGISDLLARAFAVIYGTPDQKDEWEKTYTRYVATGFIETSLPRNAKVKLFFIESGTKRFVYKLHVVRLYPPFRAVKYGPEKTIHASSDSKQGVIDINHPKDGHDIDVTGDLSKHTNLKIEGSFDSGEYWDGLEVKRRIVREKSPAKVKVIEHQDSTETFSVGDVSGAGKEPFISVEMADTLISSDPDFKEFCDALEMLRRYRRVSVLEMTYADLPPGKRFSRLHGPTGVARKYACAMVKKRDEIWLIMELCNKDGYSISTLFTRCLGNKEKLVDSIIDKLMLSNGSWIQEHFPKHTYKTLDHHKNRSTVRWAELMYDKMF